MQDHEYDANALCGVPVYATVLASNYGANPQRDGQAELTWIAGYIRRWFASLKTDVHLSTNRAWHTLSIETIVLPLSQTTTILVFHFTIFVPRVGLGM